MIPLIMGALAVVAIGSYLKDEEEGSRRRHEKKLRNMHNENQQDLDTKRISNQHKKVNILFYEIKREQGKLKKERNKLRKILKSLPKSALAYDKTKQDIQHISVLIEKKQNDANSIKEGMLHA